MMNSSCDYPISRNPAYQPSAQVPKGEWTVIRFEVQDDDPYVVLCPCWVTEMPDGSIDIYAHELRAVNYRNGEQPVTLMEDLRDHVRDVYGVKKVSITVTNMKS